MQVKNNLNVLLVSSPENLENLRAIFQTLSNAVTIPCNLIADFESRLVMRAQDTPTTFYGGERIHNFSPVIEFPDNFFNEPNQLRLIILLHELIHAYQRQTVLLRWDQLTMDKLREYRALANFNVAMTPTQQRGALRNSLRAEIELFHSYFQIIFEAWNHLFMRNNYPEFFEEEMINVHQRISNGTNDGKFDDWNQDFIFHMHVKLLEATFFKNITQGIEISNKFNKLAEFWLNKLKTVCDKNQFKKLNSVIDTMTRIDSFPDSTTLEKQYLIICQLIRERRVFDDDS